MQGDLGSCSLACLDALTLSATFGAATVASRRLLSFTSRLVCPVQSGAFGGVVCVAELTCFLQPGSPGEVSCPMKKSRVALVMVLVECAGCRAQGYHIVHALHWLGARDGGPQRLRAGLMHDLSVPIVSKKPTSTKPYTFLGNN